MFVWFCELWHLFLQIEDYSDLMDVAFTITLTTGFFQSFLLYFLLNLQNKDRILEIFEYFENLLASKDELLSVIRTKFYEKHMKIAHYCARYFLAATLFCWFFVAVFLTYLSGFSSPLLFTIPGIPKESVFFYPVNLISQTFLFLSGNEHVIISDVIIMIMIVFCQSEQESIANAISMLDSEDVAKNQGETILKTAFEAHLRLTEEAKALTQSFWHIYMMKLLIIMMYLCSMFMTFQDVDKVSFAVILSIFVMTSETFILCFFGEMLKSSSDRLPDAIYMTRWYEMKLKSQKIILILMTRFQHPVKVEAFGFGTISLYTFVQVCILEQESIAKLILTLNNEDIAKKQGEVIARKIYQTHLSLSEQAKELTESFWHIYMQKLILIMMYLCSMFMTFQSIDKVPFAAVLSVIVMTCETFILCFFGEMLSNSSDRMQNAIYMTKWYEMRVKEQKIILILMTRFHLPIKVETFGFGTISLFTFVQICKAALTYAAVLYTVFQ
ncbi:odorant receptor 85b-like [Phlebotomus argentipes]|uniref:odorant receptor 85b-like n=1 Tax=Phlebotomus argentipes TaxID=94469 RepID=UPI0028933DC3|nr:odorant receptor 85b-like [Phlebotomus argentipes]